MVAPGYLRFRVLRAVWRTMGGLIVWGGGRFSFSFRLQSKLFSFDSSFFLPSLLSTLCNFDSCFLSSFFPHQVQVISLRVTSNIFWLHRYVIEFVFRKNFFLFDYSKPELRILFLFLFLFLCCFFKFYFVDFLIVKLFEY